MSNFVLKAVVIVCSALVWVFTCVCVVNFTTTALSKVDVIVPALISMYYCALSALGLGWLVIREVSGKEF